MAAAAEQLNAVPDLRRLYPRALAASARPALRRLPGLGRARGDELPDTELSLPAVEIDRENLVAYDRVCGFGVRDELPPTYLHLVAFPLSMRIMTDARFPFPVIGLVHVRNRIEHGRPVDATERPGIRVWADHLERTERGREFQILAEAEVGGEVVWRSASTYLRRGGGSGGRTRRPGGGSSGADAREPAAMWRVPSDAGRRYAAVSGDINPIHLHPATARLFGLPGAIAHGMWLKARCLAALEGSLPNGYAADVRFKLPVRLPSKVGFWARRADADGWDFGLDDWSRGRTHVEGRVERLG